MDGRSWHFAEVTSTKLSMILLHMASARVFTFALSLSMAGT